MRLAWRRGCKLGGDWKGARDSGWFILINSGVDTMGCQLMFISELDLGFRRTGRLALRLVVVNHGSGVMCHVAVHLSLGMEVRQWVMACIRVTCVFGSHWRCSWLNYLLTY